MSGEALVTQLTIHSPNMAGIRGGEPSLVSTDVAGAAAMGSLSNAAFIFSIVRLHEYDRATYRQALGFAKAITKRLAKKSKWDLQQKHPLFLDNLAMLALGEFINDRQCNCCKGEGMSHQGDECGKCKGTGKRASTFRYRAAIVGVSTKCYARNWDNRMRQVLGEILMLEGDCMRHLAQKVGH